MPPIDDMAGRAGAFATLGRRPALLMLGTGVLITLTAVALARLSFGLVLPPMREALGLSYEQAGHLGTATALGYLSLVMVAGGFAARRGGRAAILLGLLCVALGFAGLSLATHYAVLLALMTLLGFGTAFAYTPLISLIGTWFVARRGLAIGVVNSGVGIGLMSAGWLVPYLAASYGPTGWRYVWALFAVIAGMVLLSAWWFIRDPPRPASVGSPGGEADARAGRRQAVFHNPYVRIVAMIYAIVGLTYIVQAIFMFSFALHAGIDAVFAGRLASLMGLLGIFAGPVWGSLSDRLGRGASLMLAMGMAFVSTVIPVAAPTAFGFAAHYLILGLSVTGMFTSVLAASTERVPTDAAPLAVSFVTLFFAAGQLIGPTAAGWLIEYVDGFRSTFALSASLILVGVVLAWRLTRLPAPPEPTRDNRTPR